MFSGRRQPSCDGTSRMTRECHVRICERLGVKFPGPTRQSLPKSVARATSAFPPKAAGAPDVAARSGGLVWPRPSNAWVRLARLGQSTQPLTSWRCGRGVSC
jgi:hypothetical protein